MPRAILLTGLAAASAAVLLAAPGVASATCGERKATGTILGGLGGALLGNSISKGGGGAVVGGLGGAVVGHEIAKSGCGRYRTTAYRSSSANRSRSVSRSYAAAPRPVRYVYYDQYGQPISSGPAPSAVQQYGAMPATYSAAGACRTETRSFYDERGLLVQRPMQICDR